MPVNHYFQDGNGIGNTAEKRLYEDLIIEGLKIYGQDVYYLPRTLVNRDLILGEDMLSKFSSALLLEAYMETTEGFAGEQEIVNKFGLEIREDTTFMISKRRFDQAVDDKATLVAEGRPNEGDIIYLPLMNSFFEIQFVQDQEPFFQLGQLPVYKLVCTRWEYSSEELNTGVGTIDSAEDQYSLDQLAHQNSLESGTDRAFGTTALSTSLISPKSIESVTVTNGGSYLTAPTVTFADPTGGGNETSIVKFGSRAYDGGNSGTTIPTTGVTPSDTGAVEFWLYIAERPAPGEVLRIAEWGSNDAKQAKHILQIQNTNPGDVCGIFYYRPTSDIGTGVSGTQIATNLGQSEFGRWNWFRLAQTDTGSNRVSSHFFGSSGTNASVFSGATFNTQIINADGFDLNPDGDFADGKVFIDELRFTSDGANTVPTLPTATEKNAANTLFFQDGERVTATGTAVLTNNVLTSVTITEAGNNYETAPTVTFGESESGSILLENDSASGDANYLLLETYDLQTQSNYAQNNDLDAQAGFDTSSTTDDILDFTERNPFGEVDF